MSIEETTTPGIRPAAVLLLTVLVSGCGSAGPAQEQAAAPARPAPEEASMRSVALHPVERPVARPMDRGNEAGEDPQAVPAVERPVAKPMDRGFAESGQGS